MKPIAVPAGRLPHLAALLAEVEASAHTLTAGEAMEAGALAFRAGAVLMSRHAVLSVTAPPTMRDTGPTGPDVALGLREAAALFGEPIETFRRRLEYRKALLTRPGERRLRYSRVELERIRQDRLAGNVANL